TDADIQILSGNVGIASNNSKAAAASIMASLQSAAASVLIKFVDDDVTLTSPSLAPALAELIRQMEAESESVDASAVAASITAGSNTGNGVIVVSTKRGDGLVNENMLAEVVDVAGQTGGTS